MLNLYQKDLPKRGYARVNLLYPTFAWAKSDSIFGKIYTKEISFNNRFSLTSNNTYVNLIIVVFGFGIQIEIKE